MVVLIYAILGPAVCAGLSLLFRASGLIRFLPRRDPTAPPLPPAPSLQNVLFGVGFVELALTSGLIGYWLWSMLWKECGDGTASTSEARGSNLGSLMARAAYLGPLLVLLALPLSGFGTYLRTAPADQPLLVRPFFAILGGIVIALNELLTGVIPVVIIPLGFLLGIGTALAVALVWPRVPDRG